MTETLEEILARHAKEINAHIQSMQAEAYAAGQEGRPVKKTLSLSTINRIVAEEKGVLTADLLHPTRSVQRVAQARFEAYRRAREQGYSLSEIGRYYGRDHSTIAHGVDRAIEIITQNTEVAIQ